MLPQTFSAATTRGVALSVAATPLAAQPATRACGAAGDEPAEEHGGSARGAGGDPHGDHPTIRMGLSLIPISIVWALVLGTMAANGWNAHVHAVLAQAGLKRGGARDRVIELLAAQPCALSAVEIEDALRAQGRAGRPRAARASTACSTCSSSMASSSGLRSATARRASSAYSRTAHHHHHLVCEQCGRLVAFDDAGLERAIDGAVRAARRPRRQPRRASARVLSALRLTALRLTRWAPRATRRRCAGGACAGGRARAAPGWTARRTAG